MKPHLDFAIIGAQKAGTTSLFAHLNAHPRVAIPEIKETNYFLRNTPWPEFAGRFFDRADERTLWGEACPLYLPGGVIDRIAREVPDLRLVAILRDPVRRAYSHYTQNVRKGWETRRFTEVVDDQLSASGRERGRAIAPRRFANLDYERDEPHACVAWSEYGRMLDEYARRFGPEQLLVTFLEDLERNPLECLDRVLGFLGLEPGFVPPNLGKRYMSGDSKRFFAVVRAIKSVPMVRRVWRLLPDRLRTRLGFRLNLFQTNAAGESPLTDETRRRLQSHFTPDVQRLRELIGRDVPWPAFAP